MTLVWALVVLLLLTILVCFVEITSRSKARLGACHTRPLWVYASLVLVGNLATTGFALYKIVGPWLVQFPETARPYVQALLAPFLGVFAFQGILQRTNVLFADMPVLSIQDWIDKARIPAEAAATQKETRLQAEETERLAGALKNLATDRLNAYLQTYCTDVDLAKVEEQIQQHGLHGSLYRAQLFATHNVTAARAAVREIGKRELRARGASG